ncbi:MAG: gliding motility-associated C-terminal domain-containing protein [Bacteroidales bacterium]|nr:gliding motility-associated C-terminal domain-containing protein [Bacteroidales bacterium]
MNKYLPAVLINLFLLSCIASAQIYSSTADAVKDITYDSYTGDDQLFVFYQTEGVYSPGSLSADGPGTGDYDFLWNKYDPETDGFTIPILTETGVQSSTISGLDDGGYRMSITDGSGFDTTFLAWVMLDNLRVWNKKDPEGNIPSVQSNCSEINTLTLIGNVEIDSLYYFDPITHDTLWYENDFNIEWSSDDPDLFIPNRTNKYAMQFNTTESPPVEDTWFILTATDSLGMTETDSVFFVSPFTKAEFTVEYYDKVTMEWDNDLNTEWSKDKGSLDAPLSVRFINKSVNGFEYVWILLDTVPDEELGVVTKEVEFTSDYNYQPEFTYYTADRYYYPYLISFGKVINPEDQPCRDTFMLEDGIQVVASELLIPNVFTPNGDEINDVFLFKHQSLKQCRITIADRTGRVVYRMDIDNIYEWEGWRGTILNTDIDAPVGQYYYVVEGTGYDNKEFKDPNYLERLKNQRESNGSGIGGNTDPAAGNDDNEPVQNLYTGWIYLFRKKGQ